MTIRDRAGESAPPPGIPSRARYERLQRFRSSFVRHPQSLVLDDAMAKLGRRRHRVLVVKGLQATGKTTAALEHVAHPQDRRMEYAPGGRLLFLPAAPTPK